MSAGEDSFSGEKMTDAASETWKTPSESWESIRTASRRRKSRPCSSPRRVASSGRLLSVITRQGCHARCRCFT